MKLACLALLILLLISPAIVAQDDKPAKPAAVELMALYKQAGRSWTHRVIHSIRGESPDVETSTTRVTKLEEGFAQCVTDSESADRTRFTSSNFVVDPANVPEEAKSWADSPLPDETLDTGFRQFACKKHVAKTEAVQTTTWVSIEFHPLIVKQVTIEQATTSIRKLTAFSAGDVDPWLLYRKEGRRFKVKASGQGKVAYFDSKIVKSAETGAEMEVTESDADGKQVGQAKSVTVDFAKRLRLVIPEGVDEVKSAGDEVIEVAAGKFECYIVELNKWKFYFSKVWAELPVKVETDTGTIELVEFELGHDAHAFYRTAGNYYVTTSVTKFQGGQSETKFRTEVKSVEELEVTWLQIYYDNRGKEVFRQENSLTLSEEDEPAAFSGEIEEMVETPAGRLPAIRTDIDLNGEGSYVTWTWNGIVVRTEQRMEGMEVTVELTELNLQ